MTAWQEEHPELWSPAWGANGLRAFSLVLVHWGPEHKTFLLRLTVGHVTELVLLINSRTHYTVTHGPLPEEEAKLWAIRTVDRYFADQEREARVAREHMRQKPIIREALALPSPWTAMQATGSVTMLKKQDECPSCHLIGDWRSDGDDTCSRCGYAALFLDEKPAEHPLTGLGEPRPVK